MKKLLSILLAALLVLSLAACSSNNNPGGSDTPNNETGAVNSALELLNTVWASYGDDEKFPSAGGDMTEENMSMEGPGKFGVEDAAMLDSTLGFPEASVAKIDDAASLVHMMNANTFTCGAFHVANAADVDAVAAEVKDNIMNRQWICGFPDKLVIVNVDGYIVAFFGATDLVDGFNAKLAAAYTSAKTVCDEPIA
ncbi:MAG: bacteriocin transport accessory protein [Eubacterium sp.]|nr:bacteriocin transport accessory protein [Eubacterium sp.]